MLLASSRSLSEWLQMAPDPSVNQNLEGNAVDRAVFTVLLLMGLVALAGRGRKILTLLQTNWPIVLFIGYCAVSTLWSEFTAVALKRWVKALGDPVMIMIVISDPQVLSSIKTFLARTSFVLVPLSILFIKYFPDLGARRFNPFDGTQGFVGVATDKNMLGAICLVSGIGAVWRLVHGIRDRRQARSNRPLIAQAVVLTMVLWLLWIANSMTSIACFTLASGVIVSTSIRALARRRVIVHAVCAMAVAAASAALFLNAGATVLSAVGRDPTLTGRTELWGEVIDMTPSVVIGAGFESFWLGSRLEKLWAKYYWHPNEAHNGYLEVFLNLGWVGVFLLAVVIVTGYRRALGMLRWDPDIGRLKLACVVAGVIYALTEGGFRMMHPMWIATMLAVIGFPENAVPQTVSASDVMAAAPPVARPRRPSAYAFRLAPPVKRAEALQAEAPQRHR